MITLDNYYQNTLGRFRRVSFIPKDAVKLEGSSSASQYYISSDGLTLYRCSNHWANKECLFIGSCVWFLLDNSNDATLFKIGVIKLKNLKVLVDLDKRDNRYGREVLQTNLANILKVEKIAKTKISCRFK